VKETEKIEGSEIINEREWSRAGIWKTLFVRIHRQARPEGAYRMCPECLSLCLCHRLIQSSINELLLLLHVRKGIIGNCSHYCYILYHNWSISLFNVVTLNYAILASQLQSIILLLVVFTYSSTRCEFTRIIVNHRNFPEAILCIFCRTTKLSLMNLLNLVNW
jgi:hypothetical protein